jgi:hypothetical protein
MDNVNPIIFEILKNWSLVNNGYFKLAAKTNPTAAANPSLVASKETLFTPNAPADSKKVSTADCERGRKCSLN